MTRARAIAFIVAALALAGIGLLFLWVRPAHSQTMPSCRPIIELLAYITGPQYGETLQERAMGTFLGRPALILFFANPKTETWSMIAVPASGVGCALGAGQGWKREPVGNPA